MNTLAEAQLYKVRVDVVEHTQSNSGLRAQAQSFCAVVKGRSADWGQTPFKACLTAARAHAVEQEAPLERIQDDAGEKRVERVLRFAILTLSG